MWGLSYRQTKRVWRRYRERGAEGLKQGNAERESNRGKPRANCGAGAETSSQEIFRAEDELFGPTLAAEHLAVEDDIVLDHQTLRRWMPETGL